MKSTKFKLMLLCVLLLSVLITGCLNKTAVLTTLEITPKEVSLDVGQTQEFTVVGKDADGKIFEITPLWVVDGEVGTVSPAEGKTVTFEATTSGSGTIKVTAGKISTTAQITVDPKLTTLEITPAEVSLDRGEKQEFTVVGKDENGNVMDVTPSWGVNGEIGTISSTEGKIVTFEATTYGSGNVKVNAGDITATSQINVELTESRVNSFMETYKELFYNQDAEGIGAMHSDPCTTIRNDTPQEVSREDLIAGFIDAFGELGAGGHITIVDWEITVSENVAAVIINVDVKGETFDITSRSELTVKNLEGNLFIFAEKVLN